jgi:hypothetical protein
MRKHRALLAFVMYLCCPAYAYPGNSSEDAVTPCQISVPLGAREATFTVVYRFRTKEGRPVNIRRVKNDFLKDEEFAACISRWTLPSLSGVGVAEFSYKTGEGWTKVIVSGKGFKKSLHFENDRWMADPG